jgi:hypothetical protein
VTGYFVSEPVANHVHVAAQYEQLIGERQRGLDLVDRMLDPIEPPQDFLLLLRGRIRK